MKSRVEETTTTANTKGPRSITEKLVPKSISYLQLLAAAVAILPASSFWPLFLMPACGYNIQIQTVRRKGGRRHFSGWDDTQKKMIMEKRQEWEGVGVVVYTKIVATMNRIPTEDYRKITRKGNWNWMLLAQWRR